MVLFLLSTTFFLLTPQSALTTIEQRTVIFEDRANRLAGSLFLPDRSAPYPGVVLLNGSNRGPRSEYLLKIARFLAEQGVAVLTYDSPGTGRSSGSALIQTREDRAGEALAAHRFLQKQEGPAPDRVGLWGISEGASIALQAAGRDREVAFVIAVSASVGLAPMDQSRFRVEMVGLEQGLSLEEIQKATVLQEIQWALLVGQDIVEWRLIEKKTEAWPDESWQELIEVTRKCRGELSREEEAAFLNAIRRIFSQWDSEKWFEVAMVDLRKYQRFMALEPAQFFSYLKRGPFARGDWNHCQREPVIYSQIRCPVLALWGGRDDYVSVNRSEAALKDCFTRAGNRMLTCRHFPEASHIMTVPGENQELIKEFLAAMAAWLQERLGQ